MASFPSQGENLGVKGESYKKGFMSWLMVIQGAAKLLLAHSAPVNQRHPPKHPLVNGLAQASGPAQRRATVGTTHLLYSLAQPGLTSGGGSKERASRPGSGTATSRPAARAPARPRVIPPERGARRRSRSLGGRHRDDPARHPRDPRPRPIPELCPHRPTSRGCSEETNGAEGEGPSDSAPRTLPRAVPPAGPSPPARPPREEPARPAVPREGPSRSARAQRRRPDSPPAGGAPSLLSARGGGGGGWSLRAEASGAASGSEGWGLDLLCPAPAPPQAGEAYRPEGPGDPARMRSRLPSGGRLWAGSCKESTGPPPLRPRPAAVLLPLGGMRPWSPPPWMTAAQFPPAAQRRSLLKKAPPPDLWHPETTSTQPILINGEKHYEVSAIRDARIYSNRLQYLVSWKGCLPGHDEWVAAEHIKAPKLIQDFHRSCPSKLGGGP
ncbi:basic salivary proline-rich protein 1-like [Sphaerodactylus townsendi]|uniref:basic salivary proline-rich protein 1-like n=1 Tax=Sphaerodactylus townsendi TaxID=933632 RepID=UPI0020263710|nr:basic salivary proline-rich protein 1-like [Sphaerodactylus townsendi]